MRQVPRSPLSFKLQRVANVPEHPPPSTRLMSCAHIANRRLSRIIGARRSEVISIMQCAELLGQNEELIRVFSAMPAGTFAVAVFHAQRNGAQSGLFAELERRHGAFRTTLASRPV